MTKKTKQIKPDNLPLREIERQLKPKVRLALDLYLSGSTKADALREAGYSQASMRVFTTPLAKAYCEKKVDKFCGQYNVTQASIIEELAKIGFSNIGHLLGFNDEGDMVFDLSQLTDREAAAITEFSTDTYTEGRGKNAKKVKKVKVKIADKRAALSELARIKGLHNDKLHITGELSLAERLQKGRDRVAREKVERDRNHAN